MYGSISATVFIPAMVDTLMRTVGYFFLINLNNSKELIVKESALKTLIIHSNSSSNSSYICIFIGVLIKYAN